MPIAHGRPKKRARFWSEKFAANVSRDNMAVSRLKVAGWRVMIVWECETRDLGKLAAKIAKIRAKEKAGVR